MLTLGQFGLGLGFIASIAAVIMAFVGHAQRGSGNRAIAKATYYASFISMLGFSVASIIMIVAFFTKNFSIYYVASNHSTDVSSLAWLYDLSGIWAGREGSLLFWTWLMTLFAGYISWKGLGEDKELTSLSLGIFNIIIALFAASMIFADVNNPFIATPAQYLVDGQLVGAASSWGMNPLLQHWAMILHPPTLFIGYAGLAVPFAFAMGTLILNDTSDSWIRDTDRITLFSWLFLGIGIGLGSVWAYVVLGWGGYWAWDPVENASVLPWFVGVAMIHSFTMYRRRGAFKRWAIMTSAITFAMVVLGTFITRSGLVQSVHAFAPDNLSTWLFLSIILGALLAGAIGLAIRWKDFAGNDDFESLTSREAGYYFNNVIMTVASFIIAYMTVSSALPAWMPFGGQSLGATAYEMIARPVGILYLFILGVCPLLSWGKTSKEDFVRKFKWPSVVALIMFALLMAEYVITLRPVYQDMVALGGDPAREFLAFGPQWVYDIMTILAFAISSWLISAQAALFIRGVRARMQNAGDNVGQALAAVFLKARTQSGGYLSHIAMGIIVIGLVGSAMYVRDVSFNVPTTPGSEFSVSNYRLVLTGTEQNTLSNGDVDNVVNFDVYRDGKKIGAVQPSQTTFARQGQTRLNAVVLSEPLRDIFVVYQGTQGSEMSINVKINPLIWFVWAGFGILMGGTLLASWPKKKALRGA